MAHESHQPTASHGHETHPAPSADAHAGPAEIPPEPTTRWISPARADYEAPVEGRSLIWPVFWLAVAAVLWFLASLRPGEVHGPGEAHEPGAVHEPASRAHD